MTGVDLFEISLGQIFGQRHSAPGLVHHVHDTSQPSQQSRFRTVHIFVLPFGLAKQLKPLCLSNPSYQTLHQLDRINFSGSDLRPAT